MDKILSIQTIKNVFAALGAKTSDDNYGVALLDKTTAEPKGLMGMSDLASVLGVAATFQTDSCTVNGVTVTVYKCFKNIIVYFSGTVTAAFEDDVFVSSRGTRCSFDLGTPMNNRLWLPIFNGYGEYCGYVSMRPSQYSDFYLRLNTNANFGDTSVGATCVSWIAK